LNRQIWLLGGQAKALKRVFKIEQRSASCPNSHRRRLELERVVDETAYEWLATRRGLGQSALRLILKTRLNAGRSAVLDCAGSLPGRSATKAGAQRRQRFRGA